MKDLSVSLEEHFLNFIKEEIASGRYQNANEVIHEGLQLLGDRQKISGDLKEIQELFRPILYCSVIAESPNSDSA